MNVLSTRAAEPASLSASSSRRAGILCLLALLVGLTSLAQDRRSAANNPTARATKNDTATEPAPATNYEIYRHITLAAGGSYPIDSKLDFSAAEQVAVTVRCVNCDSAANSLNNLVLQPFWLVPDADVFSIAEYKLGSSFPYWDAGGATFQVYGSQFRLTLQNRGKSDITIDQIVIFRRAK